MTPKLDEWLEQIPGGTLNISPEKQTWDSKGTARALKFLGHKLGMDGKTSAEGKNFYFIFIFHTWPIFVIMSGTASTIDLYNTKITEKNLSY